MQLQVANLPTCPFLKNVECQGWKEIKIIKIIQQNKMFNFVANFWQQLFNL